MNEISKMFTKVEVIGATKDAAKENSPLTLMVDATQKYNKWAEKAVVTEESQREWMKDYLKNKKFDKAGIGAYIVTQTGVLDVRERPYKFEKAKHEARTHTPEKFYVLRDTTNHEIGREKTSKAAEQKAKEFVADFKEDVTINYEWVSKEKNSLYGTMHYTPTKGARPFKLLVFGYKAVEA